MIEVKFYKIISWIYDFIEEMKKWIRLQLLLLFLLLVGLYLCLHLKR